MSLHGLLKPRVPTPSGAWYRKVEIYGDSSDSVYVEVGNSEEGGVKLIDDLAVAKKVIETLGASGYSVVPNPNLPGFSQIKPEEATVMVGAFELERKETDE